VTSKELVEAALKGLPTVHVPTGPLAVHFCARMAGVSLREYTLRPRVLADAVIRYYERFRPDAIWVSADTWVSAQAMGARVEATGPDQPFGGVGPPRVRSAADIDRIPAVHVETQGRYPLMLEALGHIVEALGKEVFVVACFDQYPFSLAAALMGINEIMLKLVEDRPMVLALMERCLEYGLAYGRALGEAGADLLSGGDSPAGLIGPHAYGEVALPFETRLIAGLKASSSRPVSLHICGRALPILGRMASSGADVLEIDHGVDLQEACRMVGPAITLWGNLDPVSVLAHGTLEAVRQATHAALQTVELCGHRRFVLSSGCTLAMETPEENLREMLKTACAYRVRV
jgi:MtaA/CmuA family methyltransferase